MRSAAIRYMALLLTFCAQQVAIADARDLSPVLQSRQTSFSIPFSIDLSSGPLVEVQLMVSTDQGESWRIYASANPAGGRFDFRAPYDGQFWFAIRTIDQYQRARPEGKLQAELRVVVDTTPPKLEFITEVGPSGEVVTAWRVSDTNLQADSFKIEYQCGDSQPWLGVAVDLPLDGATHTTLFGDVTWWPRTESRSINVRANVRDLAGNVTPVTRQISLPRAVIQSPAPVKPEVSATVPVDPFLARGDGSPRDGATPWPVDVETDSLPGRDIDRPGNNSGDIAERIDARSRLDATLSPREDRFISHLQPGRSQMDEPQIDRSQFNGFRIEDQVDLPPGARPRQTNHRQFKLSYNVDQASAQGVASVELWITDNGGRRWLRYGADPDLQSPFDVQVEREGTYGFRIVIASRNGLLTPLPQRGDEADMWVTVDQTRPEARITSALYGRDQHAGELEIRWQAADAHLTPQCVTLLYSQSPNGPWTTISSGLASTGHYFWRVEPDAPPQVYLAMSVIDAAGNEGGHQLTEPLRLGGVAPQGRILDLLPTGDNQRGAYRAPLNR